MVVTENDGSSLAGSANVMQTRPTVEQVWQLLATIPDPELPMVSITELGIVRDVRTDKEVVTVVMTPTYSGCPATEMIAKAVEETLQHAGMEKPNIETRLSPPWTSDWLAPAAAEKLRAHGVAPPGHRADAGIMHFVPACPRCGEKHTTLLAQFGATACKAMYRCPTCLEPFEYFKPF